METAHRSRGHKLFEFQDYVRYGVDTWPKYEL